MTSVHHQLDELRHEAREERDLERAADFYLTNKAILQSAYRWNIAQVMRMMMHSHFLFLHSVALRRALRSA